MRKGVEPPALAETRREAGRTVRETGRALTAEDWNLLHGDAKRQVVRRLFEDQDGLCAYCGARLRRPDNERGAPRIEHFAPRAVAPDRMFDWDNLLAVCDGQHHEAGHEVLHCDRARTQRALLQVHPALDPDPEGRLPVQITGSRLGEIDPTDDDAANDLRELNLNATRLTANRREVVEKLREDLASGEDPARLLRRYQGPSSFGLPPYAHVARVYLEKKIRQRSAPVRR